MVPSATTLSMFSMLCLESSFSHCAATKYEEKEAHSDARCARTSPFPPYPFQSTQRAHAHQHSESTESACLTASISFTLSMSDSWTPAQRQCEDFGVAQLSPRWSSCSTVCANYVEDRCVSIASMRTLIQCTRNSPLLPKCTRERAPPAQRISDTAPGPRTALNPRLWRCPDRGQDSRRCYASTGCLLPRASARGIRG